jgi:hypothetical protein
MENPELSVLFKIPDQIRARERRTGCRYSKNTQNPQRVIGPDNKSVEEERRRSV